jgi:hypothetical protein
MKGHIRQRSKGSWAIILDLGRDADGKRRQKWHTVRGTKKDAQRELAKLLHQLHTGEYVEPTQMTVADYLKTWLRDYAKVNVAGKTYERYAEIIERHLIPALGHHALPKLQPLHIQGIIPRHSRTAGSMAVGDFLLRL